MPLETFMQMQEEIAKADASTAWCLGQCSVCAMTAAYLDPDAANEIFNVAPGILAWGAINHEVQVVPGGYKASARWDFASGSRQASWLGAHVRVVEVDGSQRRKPDGSPEIRTILFPVASAVMYDVWDVIGRVDLVGQPHAGPPRRRRRRPSPTSASPWPRPAPASRHRRGT